MDRSGQSIFSQPKPIDITTARRAGFMDLESDSEDERPHVVFDATTRAGQGLRGRDADDVWV